AGVADDAVGQVTAGAAFIFSREPGPGPTSVATTFSPTPTQATTGATVFAGMAITRKIGIQGEVSIPRSVSATRQWNYSGGDVTDTTVHRDILVSGLVRVHGSRRCCGLLIGAGLVFARTVGTSVVVVRFPYNGPPVWTSTKQLPRTPRLALTIGCDFPIPLHRRLSLVPTLR